MIAIDVRDYGKKLTLEKMGKVFDDVITMMSPVPVKLGVKERVYVRPDEIYITTWQAVNIMSNVRGLVWETYRGVPIKVYEDEIE